jgi:hypothetical protein
MTNRVYNKLEMSAARADRVALQGLAIALQISDVSGRLKALNIDHPIAGAKVKKAAANLPKIAERLILTLVNEFAHCVERERDAA